MESLQADSEPFKGSLLDCLVELTTIYDRRMSKNALVNGLPLKDNQLTVELFQRAAERADLHSIVCNLPFEDIGEDYPPCVLALQNQKFCLLLEIQKEEAKIFIDQKILFLKKSELENQYSGLLILVKPKASLETEEKENIFSLRNITWFWEAIRNSRLGFSSILIASFFINLLALVSPLFVMNVYDRVVPNTAYGTLWVLAIGVIIAYSFDFLLRHLRTKYIDVAAQGIDSELSVKIFHHIIHIHMNKWPRSVGRVLNSTKEFEAFRDFITSLTVTVFIDFPFTLIFIVFIAIIGGRLALIPLILMPLTLIIAFLIQAPINKTIKKTSEVACRKQQAMVEALVGIVTLKANNAEGVTQRKWEQLTFLANQLGMRLKNLTSFSVNFAIFIQYLSNVLVVITGVYMIGEKLLTMGGLIACTILTGRVIAPVTQLVSLTMRYYQSMTSIKEVDAIMRLPSDRPSGKKFLSFESFDPKVEFKNVSFSYADSPNKAINTLNFSIQPGEHVAIIGRVGSGKSTLLKLAIGILSPDQGKVFLGNHDLQELDPYVIRKYIGYVPQNPILFSGTIRDNIVFSNPNASDEAIYSAIEISGLTNFISEYTQGLNTPVSERGENLSGGQRQAITIAQSILNNPSILVFDEPTTSMDEANERFFVERLKKFSEGKTFLLCTHKSSMLTLVDRIIILERGGIVADGKKENILQALKERQIHG